jgi:hypothetical protein
MSGEFIFKQTGNKEPKQMGRFEITVINKFDQDKRNILVCHKSEGKVTCDTIRYSKGKKSKCGEKPRRTHFHKKKYSLGFEDSLVIELEKEKGDFDWDVHVELPFVADHNLFWEVGGEEKVRVERPMINLFRDTTPKEDKKNDEARTVLVIPRDQNAWKLEIKSPRNLKEHYHPIHLLAGYFEMAGGTPDSVSVGDNNSG